MDKITVKAPAKINLTLDVLGRRENGYHDLRMIMQTIDLCDEVTIEQITAEENEELIKKAIYWHSAFRIDPQLNDREMLFAKVIRDADKIDILKVATDFPLEEIYNVATEQIHAHLITEEVMQQFRQKQAIFRDTKKVPIDNLAGHIALVFELEFPQSYEIVKEQGYLDQLLAFQSPNEGLMLQFQEMRQIMQEHLQAMAEKNRQTV